MDIKLFNSKKSRVILGIVLLIGFLLLIPLKSEAKGFWQAITDPIGLIADNILYLIVTISNALLGFFLGTILTLLGIVADMLLNPTYFPIINHDVVKIGFAITLGLANMFFVLILIIVAFATIFRIESYEAKKILPRLILIALIINFSKVIAGVVIDFSDVLTNFFLKEAMETTKPSESIMGALKLTNLFPKELPEGAGLSLTGWFNVFFGLLGSWIFGLVIIGVFIAFIALLFSRIFHLWMLIIGAPIIFLFSILPKTKSHWDRWWEELFKWAFSAPVFVFFLYLAIKTANSFSEKYSNEKVLAELGKTHPLFDPTFIFNYIIFIGILLFGVQVAKKTGVLPQVATDAWQGFKGGFKKTTGMKGIKERMQELGGKVGGKASEAASHIPGAGLVLPKAGEIRKERQAEKGTEEAGKKAILENEPKEPEEPEEPKEPEETARISQLKNKKQSDLTIGEASELKEHEKDLEKYKEDLKKFKKLTKEYEANEKIYDKEEERWLKIKSGREKIENVYSREEIVNAGREEIESGAKEIASQSIGKRIAMKGLGALTPLSGAENKIRVAKNIYASTAKSMKQYTPKGQKQAMTWVQVKMREGKGKTEKEIAFEAMEKYFKSEKKPTEEEPKKTP